MEVMQFEFAIAGRRADGGVLIALLSGPPLHRCVGLFWCGDEVARGLCRDVGSVLDGPKP